MGKAEQDRTIIRKGPRGPWKRQSRTGKYFGKDQEDLRKGRTGQENNQERTPSN